MTRDDIINALVTHVLADMPWMDAYNPTEYADFVDQLRGQIGDTVSEFEDENSREKQ